MLGRLASTSSVRSRRSTLLYSRSGSLLDRHSGTEPSITWPIMSRQRRSTTTKVVRWGLGDFFWVFGLGLLAATAVGVAALRLRHPEFGGARKVKIDATDTLIGAAAQFAAWALLLWFFVGLKGRGMLGPSADPFEGLGLARGRGLRHELGLSVRLRDWWWLFVGIGAAIVINLAAAPLAYLWKQGHHGTQDVGEQLKGASGATRFALFIVVVAIAPIIEESLFRGVLLRSVLRRLPAATTTIIVALAFGLTHVIGDIDTLPALPALVALGGFNAVLAIRSGSLSRSILVHVGFNLLGAISLLAVVPGLVRSVH